MHSNELAMFNVLFCHEVDGEGKNRRDDYTLFFLFTWKCRLAVNKVVIFFLPLALMTRGLFSGERVQGSVCLLPM